ncbi:MAG: hypothetical protein JWQ79_2516 [Mucilaginibacter sp.]|nr:hypothetical protein [Mucilaginibacter sp.]
MQHIVNLDKELFYQINIKKKGIKRWLKREQFIIGSIYLLLITWPNFLIRFMQTLLNKEIVLQLFYKIGLKQKALTAFYAVSA